VRSTISKTLHLPPSGRPRWVCPIESQIELLYLAWGHRFFGRHPIPLSRHDGWLYVAVRRGKPTLLLENQKVSLEPGDVVIIDPECATGWTSNLNHCASLLVWMWRSPPGNQIPRPLTSELLRWKINAANMRTLEQIHAGCRGEVEKLDEWAKPSLEHLRLHLDVALARSRKVKQQPPPSAMRLELAIRWMRQHLTTRDPVSSVCDYLQISSSTLHRVFLNYLKESPSSHHQRLRMERAQGLLNASIPVKEVAYDLGYRYPNDFSRAYKTFTGKTPRKNIKSVK
jgi:AraC-like DNA-binding protein